MPPFLNKLLEIQPFPWATVNLHYHLIIVLAALLYNRFDPMGSEELTARPVSLITKFTEHEVCLGKYLREVFIQIKQRRSNISFHSSEYSWLISLKKTNVKCPINHIMWKIQWQRNHLMTSTDC